MSKDKSLFRKETLPPSYDRSIAETLQEIENAAGSSSPPHSRPGVSGTRSRSAPDYATPPSPPLPPIPPRDSPTGRRSASYNRTEFPRQLDSVAETASFVSTDSSMSIPLPPLPQTSPSRSAIQAQRGFLPPDVQGSSLCVFQQTSFGTMLLRHVYPISNGPAEARYNISVMLDCFAASSAASRTNVCKGGSPDGEIIGEIQSVAQGKNTSRFLRFKDIEADVEMLLAPISGKTGVQFNWTFNEKYTIRWICATRLPEFRQWIYACDLVKKDTPKEWTRLGRFFPDLSTPPTKQKIAASPRMLPTLQIFSAGEELLDEIVISLLLIERYRLDGEFSLPKFK